MAMKRIETGLPGVAIIEPQVFGDHRGFFMETYQTQSFHEIGIDTVFVQDNHAYNACRGTLRGIHFQNAPYVQAKLVRVIRGAVMDVAVDLRRGSPTYLQWTAVTLSAENRRMLYIPKGFGHGYVTLTDDAEFCYKVDEVYNREADRSICYKDPAIGVDWGWMDPALLSEKDVHSPLLADSDCNLTYGEC